MKQYQIREELIGGVIFIRKTQEVRHLMEVLIRGILFDRRYHRSSAIQWKAA